MTIVLPKMTIATHSSSLGNGRLADGWPRRLLRRLRAEPECRGPLELFDMGHGGWTSLDLLNDAANVALLDPTHILFEGGSINSCVDTGGGPARTRAQQYADITSRIDIWQAKNPNVNLTLRTSSPVSTTVAAIRPALADYNADELVLAASLGIPTIDIYGASVKPLDPTQSNGAAPFAIAPTAGYSAFPDGAAFNPVDKAANVVVDSDSLGAWALTAGIGSIRGANAITDKLHFEVTIGVKTANYPRFGIADAAFNLANYVGQSTHSLGLYGDGNIYYNSVGVLAAGFTVSAGDTIAVEIDLATKHIYFMKGAVRTGIDYSAYGFAANTLYPAMAVNGVGSGGRVRFTPSGDGLHPNPAWIAANLEPALLTWGKAAMAAFWPA